MIFGKRIYKGFVMREDKRLKDVIELQNTIGSLLHTIDQLKNQAQKDQLWKEQALRQRNEIRLLSAEIDNLRTENHRLRGLLEKLGSDLSDLLLAAANIAEVINGGKE